jgi:hypothetical protein
MANEIIKDLPNLLMTVNVLLGYNSNGKPSAMLSRKYGAAFELAYHKRLVEYLAHQLGLRVYTHDKWEYMYSPDFKKTHIKPPLPPESARYVMSFPVMQQITMKDIDRGYNKPLWTLSRYNDIDKEVAVPKKPGVVREVQRATTLKKTPPETAIPSIISHLSTKAIKAINAGITEEE